MVKLADTLDLGSVTTVMFFGGFPMWQSKFSEVGIVLAYRRLGFSLMDKYLHNIKEYTKKDMIESYPEVPDDIYFANTPEGIARSALQVGKTAEEVAELFEMPLDFVRSLQDKAI